MSEETKTGGVKILNLSGGTTLPAVRIWYSGVSPIDDYFVRRIKVTDEIAPG